MATTLALTTPVSFGATAIAELNFREPTGKDLRTLGMPLRDGNIDNAVMHGWIGQLAGQPEPLVDLLSMADWLAAAGVVNGFFAKAALARTS